MVVNEEAIDDIQRRVNAGQIDRLRQLTVSGITVGALLELSSRGWLWAEDPAMSPLFATWRSQCRPLNAVWTDLLRGRTDVPLDLKPVGFEYMCLPSPINPGWQWDCFFKRFDLSLKHHGFSASLSLALARAMREMAENVWNHSGETELTPAPGVIAYHVTDGTMAYAVADVGRGILSSLKSDGQWEDLDNARDALEAAVEQRRTRRPGYAQGEGFNWMFRSLADLSGVMRFRTGDHALTVTGKDEARHFDYHPSPPMLGFQLSLRCTPSGNTSENFLLDS